MAVNSVPITRAHYPNLHEPGIRKVIFQAWDLYQDEYQRVYQIEGSEKAQEHEVVASGLETFDLKAEGQPISFDSMQEAYKKSFTHNTFAKGIKVTREAIRDDLYGPAKRCAAELGRTAKYTKNVQAMSIFNDATSTAIYTLNGSSPTLLSATHQLVSGGTWSNKFASATDLSPESLELGLIQFESNMPDHRGRPQMVMPKFLVVGVSSRFVARRLLETKQGRPFSNNNDVNVLLDYDLQLLVMHHMNDDGRWFIVGAPGETGFRYWDRESLTVETDKEPNTGDMLYRAFYAESHGATHPIGCYGSSA